ncbi:hypothetical protein MMC31_000137 [Peltigera leucophlebia]|nr:hypothetical protein [Peltigera leucophlebia]
MTAPFRSKPPVQNLFVVNHDPNRLDDVYINMLGTNGDRLLTEEVKWLAVTHKSFDHGRRGFNERLAFLGRRIYNLQISLALIHKPSSNPPPPPDSYGRVPFQHLALEGLENLTEESKSLTTETKNQARKRLAQLAERYGFGNVIRWKPKRASNLYSSGYEMVYAQAILAVVGAIALQRGGEVANKIVRERILDPLGLQS